MPNATAVRFDVRATPTESIFNLSNDQIADETKECPGCGSSEFLKSFQPEVRQNYNWVTYYKRGREMKKDVRVRFLFCG
jgi:hypothetical protein